MEEKQIVLKTADGVAIALWKMSSGALDSLTDIWKTIIMVEF